jgi:dCTP deaminase
MSIKSDRYIIRKSMVPSHRVSVENQFTGWAWSCLGECPEGDTNTCSEGVVKNFTRVNESDLAVFHLENPWFPMIDHFEAKQVRSKVDEKVVSYGTSSYGYDVRCADEFKVFTNIHSAMVDPKNFDPNCFVDVKGPKCIIPPNSFALARTVEWFKIPRNVLTICLGKSTYARCGIIVNVTPLEPEWEGHVTLEFSNTTPLPAVIYANEGVAQMLFLESDEDCLTSYKDRDGKYQGQSGVVVPRMK